MFNVSLKMIQVDIFVKITCNNNIIKREIHILYDPQVSLGNKLDCSSTNYIMFSFSSILD